MCYHKLKVIFSVLVCRSQMYKKELGQRAVRIWKKVVVFMLLADRLL